jgi:hypothetical protein
VADSIHVLDRLLRPNPVELVVDFQLGDEFGGEVTTLAALMALRAGFAATWHEGACRGRSRRRPSSSNASILLGRVVLMQ